MWKTPVHHNMLHYPLRTYLNTYVENSFSPKILETGTLMTPVMIGPCKIMIPCKEQAL